MIAEGRLEVYLEMRCFSHGTHTIRMEALGIDVGGEACRFSCLNLVFGAKASYPYSHFIPWREGLIVEILDQTHWMVVWDKKRILLENKGLVIRKIRTPLDLIVREQWDPRKQARLPRPAN